MKLYLNTFLILIGFTIVTSCNLNKKHAAREGNWIGKLNFDEQSLTVVLNISKSFFGKVGCNVSVSEQAVYNYEASDCQIIKDSLIVRFSGSLENTVFRGKFVNDKIKGVWIQKNYSIPLFLDTVDEKILFRLVVERALDYAQKESVYHNRVKWARLKTEVSRLCSSTTKFEQLGPALEHILDKLEDRHGRVLINNKLFRTKSQITKVSFKLIYAAYGHNKKVFAKMLDRNISYLRIPTSPVFNEIENNRYIQELQNQVCTLIMSGAKKWVIDLRLNQGGNTASMLAGLYGLFGDERVGNIIGADGKIMNQWFLRQGNIYSDKSQLTSVGKPCTLRSVPTKIIVLTSPMTSSAGEQVAISLRGLPNTTIVGEVSGGYSTISDGLKLTENIIFFISTDYFSDRNGKIYKEYVTPDYVILGGDNFKDIGQDTKVLAALKLMESDES